MEPTHGHDTPIAETVLLLLLLLVTAAVIWMVGSKTLDVCRELVSL